MESIRQFAADEQAQQLRYWRDRCRESEALMATVQRAADALSDENARLRAALAAKETA